MPVIQESSFKGLQLLDQLFATIAWSFWYYECQQIKIIILVYQ